LYFNGDGTPANFGAAHYWFNEAYKQKEPKATYFMGILYKSGLGVKKDMGTANKYFKEAESLGFKLNPNDIEY